MKLIFLAVLALGVVWAMTLTSSRPESSQAKTMPQVEPTPPGSRTLVLAAGCFWCVEAIFEELEGVSKVESGYTGGQVENPTYAQVCTGKTGHAEAVRITYDPKVIDADDILRIFFTTHDPTTLNRQGADVGTQYRSAIFYASEEEKARAQRIIAEVEKEGIWPGKIVTSLEPLSTFYLAEGYHQDYFRAYETGSEAERAGMNVGYCRAVIEPKVRKFREKYADKLKKKG